jgi:hypothetical protein
MSSTGNPLRVIIPGYQLEDLVIGILNLKKSLTLPQNTTSTLFTVTGGAILVTSLVGVVTTAIQNQACNLSLGTVPSAGTAAAAGIGGPNSIQNLAAGTVVAAPSSVGSPGAALTAPSVPGSTTPIVNPYHGTVTVTVTGGTVTAVFVNGNQVGSGDGAYDVPQHGSISVTYSVAPTWTWTGTVNLSINANGTLFVPKDTGFIVSPGTITWTTNASNTGAMSWYLNYIQLDTVLGDQVSGRGVVT